MNETLFSVEPTSVRDLADRWGTNTHSVYYVIKSRRIPHAKMVGPTRLFDTAQQRAIYLVLHKYLEEDDGGLNLIPPLDAFVDQEKQEEGRLMERVAILEAENARLKAESATKTELNELKVEVKADLALLKRLVLQEPDRR